MHTFSDSEMTAPGFQFPGRVDLSAMGQVDMNLEHTLPQVLRQMGVDVLDEHTNVRLSSAGKYVAIRMAFIAQSRMQYETALAAVRGYPGVKWVM